MPPWDTPASPAPHATEAGRLPFLSGIQTMNMKLIILRSWEWGRGRGSITLFSLILKGAAGLAQSAVGTADYCRPPQHLCTPKVGRSPRCCAATAGVAGGAEVDAAHCDPGQSR